MRTLYAAKYVSPRLRPLTTDEAHVRAVAYALKAATPDALDEAAAAMAALIDGPCWLVPIPASTGQTTANEALARRIAAQVPGARVRVAIQRTQPVPSSCALRRSGKFGLPPQDHHFKRTAGPMLAMRLYFVDNVVTTGSTFEAAHQALGFGDGLAYADASNRRNIR